MLICMVGICVSCDAWKLSFLHFFQVFTGYHFKCRYTKEFLWSRRDFSRDCSVLCLYLISLSLCLSVSCSKNRLSSNMNPVYSPVQPGTPYGNPKNMAYAGKCIKQFAHTARHTHTQTHKHSYIKRERNRYQVHYLMLFLSQVSHTSPNEFTEI